MTSMTLKGSNTSDTPHAVLNIITSLINELLELGCSLSDIAQHTRISMRTLRRLHKGEVLQPTPRTFSRVLSFYCHHTANSIKQLVTGE